MVARVMNNFDFKDLNLVNPRTKWPNKISFQASKNAKFKSGKGLKEAVNR